MPVNAPLQEMGFSETHSSDLDEQMSSMLAMQIVKRERPQMRMYLPIIHPHA